MNGFERRKKEKEKAILDTTKALSKNGILNTRFLKSQRRQGIPVTIFKYFETKDNLVLSTVNYFVDESFRSFEELVNKKRLLKIR